MLKIGNFSTPSPEQWEMTIEGMRSAMNSWDKSDSFYGCDNGMRGCRWCSSHDDCIPEHFLGDNDRGLMLRLNKGGAPHAKYRRYLPVHVTVTAPLYWWKEFETYRIGVASNPSDIEFNSCSTMHKIHAKEFELSDFSTEHLFPSSLACLKGTVQELNYWRSIYLNGGNHYIDTYEPKDKDVWWQLIQLLPSSYNQRRTIKMNYQVLYEIYEWRKNHKLDEWHTFCHWIEELPNSELIIGERE